MSHILTAILALTIVTNSFIIDNHGYWPLAIPVGARGGDKVTMDVRCDTGIGECLVKPLVDTSAMDRVVDEFDHQRYEYVIPAYGSHLIYSNYWKFGDNAHYHIEIVVTGRTG